MGGEDAKSNQLFATIWVHVFEEDTERGAVYRSEDDDIPLSRRPRERIQLESDGRASVSVPGADDRHVEQPAAWHKDGDTVVIQTGDRQLRIVDQSSARLIVQSHAGS